MRVVRHRRLVSLNFRYFSRHCVVVASKGGPHKSHLWSFMFALSLLYALYTYGLYGLLLMWFHAFMYLWFYAYIYHIWFIYFGICYHPIYLVRGYHHPCATEIRMKKPVPVFSGWILFFIIFTHLSSSNLCYLCYSVRFVLPVFPKAQWITTSSINLVQVVIFIYLIFSL